MIKPVEAVANVNDFSKYIDSSASVSLLPMKSVGAQAVYDPQHSLSNEQGYVFKPDINIAAEMVTLNEATRAYEANVKAFNTYREMGAKAMEIGK